MGNFAANLNLGNCVRPPAQNRSQSHMAYFGHMRLCSSPCTTCRTSFKLTRNGFKTANMQCS